MNALIIVGICILLNALFAAYEMAFVSVAKPELRALSRKGNKRAHAILHLREKPERTLSIIQIGITLVGAVGAAVGGAGAAEVLEPILISEYGLSQITADLTAVVMVVIPLTYFNVVLGELVPKSLALKKPMLILMAGTPFLVFFDKIFAPVVTVLEVSTRLILRLFMRGKKGELPEIASPSSIEIDMFSPLHQRFMFNMANLEKRVIVDSCVEWEYVNFIRLEDTLEDVTASVFNSGHTRLPVLKDNVVVGVLHTKEFMILRESGERNWQTIIRSIITLKPKESLISTLRLMQEKRSHMCVVIDPQNLRIVGIVTLEDIIEEIVGDIFDEDDDGRVKRIFISRIRERHKAKSRLP